MDMMDASNALLASWKRTAAIVLGFTLVALALALWLPPVYRAEVLMEPVDSDVSALSGLASQFGGIAELAGLSLPKQGRLAASVATLGSRSLTDAFIQDNNLLPVLFPSKWDSVKKRWKSNDPRDQPMTWDAYRFFDQKVRTVSQDRRSGLITLVINWRNPMQASDWANELVRRSNAKLKQESIEEAQKTINYLSQQLDTASSLEVRQLLFRLIETETKKMAVANSRDEYAFRVIDPAVAPRKKSSPNRALIVLTGIFLGVFASIGLVLLGAAQRQSQKRPQRESELN